MTPSLVRGGVDGVWIGGVEFDIRYPRVLVDLEYRSPGDTAVCGPVHAALATGGPQRPLGRYQHRIAVARIDENLADVLRCGEPHLLPGAASVEAPVYAAAPGHVAAADVLAGTDPDHVRVVRIDGDGADRVRRLVIEDRRPGDAGIGRLPQTARANRHVPGAAVFRMHLDVRDAAAHERGADAAQIHRADGLGNVVGPLGRLLLRRDCGSGKHGEGGKKRERAARGSVVHEVPRTVVRRATSPGNRKPIPAFTPSPRKNRRHSGWARSTCWARLLLCAPRLPRRAGAGSGRMFALGGLCNWDGFVVN